MTAPQRRIEYMPLAKIIGAAANPKDHASAVITQSVRRFGFVEAMTLDERTQRLVAGHGRVDILKMLKARGKKPPDGVQLDAAGEWLVPVQRGWASKDDVEARAYVVASNKTSEAGGWKKDELAEELAAIADDSMLSLLGTGFDEHELDRLLDDGAPEKKPRNTNRNAVFQVLIEVDSEEALAALLERFDKEGIKCRPLLF